MPRRRAPPPDPSEEAAAERKRLTDIRARLHAAGIKSTTLRQLLMVATVRSGVEKFDDMIRRSQQRRQTAVHKFIDGECKAHAKLHALLDDPLDTDCQPKAKAACSSRLVVVRLHFTFCRQLMRPKPRTKASRPLGIYSLPGGARDLGSVIAALVDAGLNQREVAMLLLDHERTKRAEDSPLTERAIDDKHHGVRSALHAHRRKSKRAR